METALMSADEFELLPVTDERYELVGGELRKIQPAGFYHGATGFDLALFIGQYVREHDLGIVVLAETGFRIEREGEPDSILAPDIGFVAKANLPDPLPRRGYFRGFPDLAVEIVSPGDAMDEVDEKVEKYLGAGTRLVWVVRPLRRRVEVNRANGQTIVLNLKESLDGEDVLPGFSLSLCQIFR